MKGFKYVDFSRKTAKNNANMILREYDHIIEEANKQSEDFRNKKFTLVIPKRYIKGDIQEYKIGGKNMKVNFEFTYKELKKIVKALESNHEDLIQQDKICDEIMHEKSRFRVKYEKKQDY